MKTVTLSLDEDLLRESREYAAKHRTTLNSLIRAILKQTVSRSQTNDWLKELFREMDQHPGSSRGLKWNRKDLYDL